MLSETQPTSTSDRVVPGAESDPRRLSGIWIVAAFAVPAVIFFAFGIRAVEPINGQDGYLYTGIAARMTDFLTRFPDSYYGVRFGHIFPTWLVTKLFGLEAGHLVWRFVLLGGICALLATAPLRRPAQAMLAAFVVCTSPVVLVAAFSTYTLSTGVLTFVAGSVVLAVGPSWKWKRKSALVPLVAGALFALAWNSNFAVLPLCLGVAAVFVVDQCPPAGSGRWRQPLASSGLLSIGALIVVVPAVLIYGVRFDIWNILAPTLAQASTPTDDQFLEVGWGWISWRHFLLLGPLSIVGSAVVWFTERDAALRGVLRRLTLSAGISLLAFAVFQWVLDTPLLSLYFYSALPLALCTTALAFSTAVVIGRSPGRVVPALAAGIALLTVTALVLGARIGASFGWIAVAAACVAACAVVGARARPTSLIVAMTSVLLVAAWATVSSPHDFPATPGGYRTDPWYDDVLFTYDGSSMDRLEILDDLARSLPSLPNERGEIAVWFDSLGPFDQLTAPFLWYRSALQSASDPPLPEMTSTVEQRIRDDRPRFILLVDGQESDIELAVDEVIARAPYRIVMDEVFRNGEWTAHVVLLERTDGGWPELP